MTDKPAWWDANAKALRDITVMDERQLGADYHPNEVRRAIVHTREDVILIVSYLSSLNGQLAEVKFLLKIIAVATAITAVSHFWK